MNSDQQNPNNSIPTSKKERSKIVGKAAGKIGFKRLGFLAKKTFAGQEKRKELAEQFNEEAAKVLFDAMKKMRGTALKVAQIASMEVDQLPESFRKELSKACYQVPPLNRAVVRKVFINEKGCPPEEVFHKFNYKAFAAASLGQVHLAETKKNEIVAVKLQYPGIADTIHTDLSLLDSILSKMPLLKRFRHTIDEVHERMTVEVDYHQELLFTQQFKEVLNPKKFLVPDVYPEYSTQKILTTEFLEGKHLDEFLVDEPSQEVRNQLAQNLWDLFIQQLYQFKKIHADPNPGNYLFLNDGRIGILDFGCIKEFDEQFIERFRQLSHTLYSGSTSDVVEKMMKLNLYDGNEDPSSLHELFLEIAAGFQHFVGDGHVDFGDVSGKLFNRAYEVSIQLLKHKQFIPDHNFLFLDRTRFGLFRVFQKLKAQVNLKNPYEFDE